MIRTQIQLPDLEHENLRRLANRLNRSMADCVREAVAAYISRADPANGVLELAGRFPPIASDELKEHDRWWAEALLSERKA